MRNSHNFKKKNPGLSVFDNFWTHKKVLCVKLTQTTISIPVYPAFFKCKNVLCVNSHLKFQIIDEANAFLK